MNIPKLLTIWTTCKLPIGSTGIMMMCYMKKVQAMNFIMNIVTKILMTMILILMESKMLQHENCDEWKFH
uniref:Putative secreted protein n=1 Tax=Xenopsylla cheopis TaxID=163159 RepID=A0A6M2E053_XENCH